MTAAEHSGSGPVHAVSALRHHGRRVDLIGALRLEDVPIAGYSELLDKTSKTIYTARGLTAAVNVDTLSGSETEVVADATVTVVADLSHLR